MIFDPNSYCPAGKPKKIKFCCSDLGGDLQKIGKMLEGDQQLGCVQFIDQLEAKGNFRSCTMTVKAELLRNTNQIDVFKSYAVEFAAKFPDCPAAWVELALASVEEQGSMVALGHLQTALDMCEGDLPANVLTALHILSEVAGHEGYWLPALGMLQLLAALSTDDPTPSRKLMSITRSASIPLPVRASVEIQPILSELPARPESDAAIAAFSKGCWRKAADLIEGLAQSADAEPIAWLCLGRFRAFAGDNSAAAEALRKYASFVSGSPSVPDTFDDAVEAETLAILLDPAQLGDQVDAMRMTWAVDDSERLMELATSDRRFTIMPAQQEALEDGSPPPRMAFIITDRPMPATAVGMTSQTVPNTLAQAFLFGRQTDRPARLEFGTVFGNNRSTLLATVREVIGPTLHGEPEEERIGVISQSRQMIQRRWAVPPDTQREELSKLARENLRDVLVNQWVDLPLGIFGNRTPRQAAADPAARVKLQAVLAIIEDWAGQVGLFDHLALRQGLGLPVPEPIELAEHQIESVPIMRMQRVKTDSLSDDDLLIALDRVELYNAPAAVKNIATAITQRPTFAGKPDRAEAFAMLVHCAESLDDSLAVLTDGRAACVDAKISCAKFDLWELPIRMARNETADAMRLLQHIEAEHIREPGVAEAVTNFLMQIGVLGPDGRPRMPAGGPAPSAPPAESNKLWTPESAASAATGGKLWTPGS